MSSIVFRTPLTQEESSFYSNQFKSLDKENLGIVTGESVRPLFAGSGLSQNVLGQIWALVDINNKGFLNESEFFAALRSIAILQSSPATPINSELYQVTPNRLPQLNIVPTASTTTTTTTIVNPVDLPVPSNNDIAQFGQLFDRSSNGQSVLPGDKAKDIFLKAKLPNQTLGEIWALCDRNASGLLDKSEFIMAMHLIQLVKNNNTNMIQLLNNHQPLPVTMWSSISQSLSNNVSTSSTVPHPLSANSTGLSSITSNPNQSPIGRTSTISRLSTGIFNSASNDWVLSPEKKQQFDVIFDSLDKQKTGSLTSQVLVPFFLSSKLNQETLATIWDLADIHNSATFTKVEFAIAMFLIQKKNNGFELPDVIPNELLHSPALNLYQTHQIPSRATKPTFDETTPQQPSVNTQVPVQNSNNGSLNDLMALNNSFNSPPPVPPPHTTTTGNQPLHTDTTISSQPPHLKKFTPTSNFGQSIVKEETDKVTPLPEFQPHHLSKQTPPAPPVQRVASVSLPQVPNFASNLNMHSSTNSTTANTVGNNVPGSPMTNASNTFHNDDLYADANASAQLSAATTDLANLSNQVSSLTTQASLTNERRARASKELQRVTEMKKNIETKLTTLRSTHEQNIKQTELLESQLLAANKEKDTLQNELNVVEANFHAGQTKFTELTQSLQSIQQENTQLKEKLADINNQNTILTQQLQEKQQHIKQERSIADVNAKQLELSEINVANLQKEISGLEENLTIYLSKQKELNEYKDTVEKQHAELQKRYEELSNTETDLNNRQLQLDERNKQIEEQEKLYHEHVSQLQSMFEDLAQRQEAFNNANEELERQNIEYANQIQQLTERQMQLAMGEIPKDAHEIVTKFATVQKSTEIDANNISNPATMNKKDIILNGADEQSTDRSVNEEEDIRTERTESDLFDKDIPTIASQSEVGDINTETNINEEPLSDRFEDNLDEYGIPRTQSFTSSVANNAPQSVRDDVELPSSSGQVVETIMDAPNVSTSVTPEQTAVNIHENDADISDKTDLEPIPGQWSNESEDITVPVSKQSAQTAQQAVPTNVDTITANEKNGSNPSIINSPDLESHEDLKEKEEQENIQLENVIDAVNIPDTNVNSNKNVHPIDQEFPPIQELEIHESDSSSSSDDDDFQDTKEAITPQIGSPPVQPGTAAVATTDGSVAKTAPSMSSPIHDDFDDEFAGLQEAAAEEDVDEDTSIHNNISAGELQNFNEPFENISHKDLNEKLNDSAFTETKSAPVAAPPFTQLSQPQVPETPANIQPVLSHSTNEVTNDEWDEIFAGFGNGKTTQLNNTQESTAQQQIPVQTPKATEVVQPKPQHPQPLSKPPVNRGIATTPKSLAVEELCGMGFTEEEATHALEKCNWVLEDATNYLLDSA